VVLADNLASRWPTCFDGSVRVLFSTTAGAGHFGPMIPIARACAAAGHEVSVAAPTSFADKVLSLGLRHLPFADVAADRLGAVFGRIAQLPREEANRVVVTEVFGRLDAQAALPGLMEMVAQLRPDIVVRDPCEFGALVAAEHAGIPQVQVAISLDEFILAVTDWLDEPLRELESLAGVERTRGAELMRSSATLTSVPAALDARSDLAPKSGRDARRFWRFRTPRHAEGPALPASWGDPECPLVYVSFGSVAGSLGQFAALYPAVLEALADQPIRVLMTTGAGVDSTALSPAPDNAWVTAWWPQASVMAEASVVIGHGGFGTTMTAVAAGVPQVVLPLFSFDQFLNAERLQAVGAGIQLLGGLAAVDDLPAALRTLLTEAPFADVAGTIAAEMATLPDVSESVGVLEELARQRA
jgi:UDP:flavonoid glycosyltransferase YjiC (YdhE family)